MVDIGSKSAASWVQIRLILDNHWLFLADTPIQFDLRVGMWHLYQYRCDGKIGISSMVEIEVWLVLTGVVSASGLGQKNWMSQA
jgi:hypothetical protein